MFATLKSYDLLSYLSPKRVVTVKKYTCSLFVLKSEPLWICLQKVDFCAYVLLYRLIIAHCAGRAGPCVLQSLVVLWCWSDDCLACMPLCLRGSSSYSAYLLFSALLLICLSFLLLPAVQFVLSSNSISLPVSLSCLPVFLSYVDISLVCPICLVHLRPSRLYPTDAIPHCSLAMSLLLHAVFILWSDGDTMYVRHVLSSVLRRGRMERER